MKKASCSSIPYYYKFSRGTVTITGIKYRGTFFTLCDTLTDETKADLKQKHGNVLFYNSRSKYAPEQKHNVIFIADKNIKAV